VKQQALLTPRQAVDFLKHGGVFMTEGALATRRNEQRLPKYTKIGGRIFYSRQELVKLGRRAALHRRQTAYGFTAE
jgi:hypothetical protein